MLSFLLYKINITHSLSSRENMSLCTRRKVTGARGIERRKCKGFREGCPGNSEKITISLKWFQHNSSVMTLENWRMWRREWHFYNTGCWCRYLCCHCNHYYCCHYCYQEKERKRTRTKATRSRTKKNKNKIKNKEEERRAQKKHSHPSSPPATLTLTFITCDTHIQFNLQHSHSFSLPPTLTEPRTSRLWAEHDNHYIKGPLYTRTVHQPATTQ